jgi:hypothetical protein
MVSHCLLKYYCVVKCVMISRKARKSFAPSWKSLLLILVTTLGHLDLLQFHLPMRMSIHSRQTKLTILNLKVGVVLIFGILFEHNFRQMPCSLLIRKWWMKVMRTLYLITFDISNGSEVPNERFLQIKAKVSVFLQPKMKSSFILPLRLSFDFSTITNFT